MNEFEYILACEKLANSKTIKSKVELLRELHAKLPNNYNPQYTEDSKYLMTLLWKVIDKLQETHYPAYIYSAITNYTDGLFKYYTEKEITADELNDIFQYCEQISLGHLDEAYMVKLGTIYKDTLPVFNYSCSLKTTSDYTSIIGYSDTTLITWLEAYQALSHDSVFMLKILEKKFNKKIVIEILGTLSNFQQRNANILTELSKAFGYYDE